MKRIDIVENVSNSPESLRKQINSLDQKITDITKSLLEIQAVALKATMSPNNGWLDGLQKRWFRSAIHESSNWHKARLLILYKERRSLKHKLEIATGTVWRNRIRRWFGILFLMVFGIIVASIILMGLITALIPIWGLIILLYMLIKRKSVRPY